MVHSQRHPILRILNYGICHCHFMFWIGSVTSVISSSLIRYSFITSYTLYYLPTT
jgi:hypothetical protein